MTTQNDTQLVMGSVIISDSDKDMELEITELHIKIAELEDKIKVLEAKNLDLQVQLDFYEFGSP
jgi:phage shock protein A